MGLLMLAASRGVDHGAHRWRRPKKLAHALAALVADKFGEGY